VTSSNGATERVRRRDEEGDFHDVEAASCPRCGCGSLRAVEDSSLVWEPGMAWDPTCSDRRCRCHVDPVIGERRSRRSEETSS